MNTRYLVLPLSLSIALAAPNAFALGLGQLKVKSGLNQPLVAEIPILSATPAELDQLDVRLASPDAFTRVGLERPGQLTANLQFSVGKNDRGQPVIRVSTPGKFQEPLLSFLVEASWGKGTVTREYTALIDPPYIAAAVIHPMTAPIVAAAPVYTPEPAPMPEPMPAAAAAPPVAIVAEPERAPEPALEMQPVAPPPAMATPEPMAPEPIAAAPEPMPAAPEPIAAAPEPMPAPMPQPAPEPAYQPAPTSGEITVERGQTLFGIAANARQDESVSVNQMMLALLRANPDAFEKDNINRLKSGSVLRIPSREESGTLTPEQASTLVREQTNAWRTPRQPVPQPAESVAAEQSSTADVPAPAMASEPAAAAAPRVAANKPRASRLEIVPPSGKAARGTQSGAAAGAGGTELRAELVEAKEDLAARNSEVTDLKTQIAELEKLNADRQSMIDVQNSDMKALQERLKQLEEQKAGTPVVAAAAAPTAPTAEAAAVPTVVPTAEATPLYLNPYVLGGGAIVLIGGLVLLLRRSKRADDELPEPAVGRRISEDADLRASLAQTRVGKAMPAIEPVVLPVVSPEAPVVAAAPVEPVDRELDTLRAAVASRPQDLEAHLSLLRLLHTRGNAADYEVAAQAMRLQVPSTMDPRWREAVIMGASLMPGHPLFSQAGWNSARLDSEPTRAPEPVAVAPEDDGLTFDIADDGAVADSFIADSQSLSVVDLPADDEPVGADDASATRIELAKAYLDIGDLEGARSMLEEVLAEGSPAARATAEQILREIG